MGIVQFRFVLRFAGNVRCNLKCVFLPFFFWFYETICQFRGEENIPIHKTTIKLK